MVNLSREGQESWRIDCWQGECVLIRDHSVTEIMDLSLGAGTETILYT